MPIDRVIAIYARENGQGMAFPMPSDGVRDAPLPTAPGVACGCAEGEEQSDRSPSPDDPPPAAPQPTAGPDRRRRPAGAQAHQVGAGAG